MIPDRPNDVVLTLANELRIVELDLGPTYRGFHFQVNGHPEIWVAPHRVRLHYARRVGTAYWEVTQLQAIGFPVLPTPSAERHRHAERQRGYLLETAPAWLLGLAQACVHEPVLRELPRAGGAR